MEQLWSIGSQCKPSLRGVNDTIVESCRLPDNFEASHGEQLEPEICLGRGFEETLVSSINSNRSCLVILRFEVSVVCHQEKKEFIDLESSHS